MQLGLSVVIDGVHGLCERFCCIVCRSIVEYARQYCTARRASDGREVLERDVVGALGVHVGRQPAGRLQWSAQRRDALRRVDPEERRGRLRGLAAELGVHISTRGRVSQATCEELAVMVR